MFAGWVLGLLKAASDSWGGWFAWFCSRQDILLSLTGNFADAAAAGLRSSLGGSAAGDNGGVDAVVVLARCIWKVGDWPACACVNCGRSSPVRPFP